MLSSFLSPFVVFSAIFVAVSMAFRDGVVTVQTGLIIASVLGGFFGVLDGVICEHLDV